MTITTDDTIAALRDLGAKRIARAANLLGGYRHSRRMAGDLSAAWAWADNRNTKASAHQAIAKWMRRPIVGCDVKPVITLSASNGRGKSATAARWVGLVRGQWLDASSLESEGWNGGTEYSRALSAPCLVVDDLGTDTGHSRALMVTLVCRRFDRALATVITTTLSLDTIASDYPGSVHSRLASEFRVLTGPDLRGQAAAPDLGEIRSAEAIEHALAALDALGATDSVDVQRSRLISAAILLDLDLDEVTRAATDHAQASAEFDATLARHAEQFNCNAREEAEATAAAVSERAAELAKIDAWLDGSR
jgi:hypothetical protein